MNIEMVKKNNQKIFDAVISLNFPIGHYAITSSGPMGVRGLRLINDADLIVDDSLWNKLVSKYRIVEEDGITKIVLNEGKIEILGEGSFFNNYAPEDPTVEEQINTAELIGGLPFVKLDFIKYFKQQLGREKDLKDIVLIDEFNGK